MREASRALPASSRESSAVVCAIGCAVRSRAGAGAAAAGRTGPEEVIAVTAERADVGPGRRTPLMATSARAAISARLSGRSAARLVGLIS